MTTYLLEIGTEELPAAHIPEARGKLADLLSCGLKEHALAFEAITTLSTPRRLTAIVSGLPAKQPDRKDKVKGPPLERCFDAYGNPTKAALGFAGKTSIALNDLDKEEIAGKTYLVANLTINGKSTSQVLSEIVPPVINQISGERLMRWGDSNLKFARPIRWIVSLLEDQIVPFKLEAIAAGRTTFGHRILAPGEIEINSPGEYEQALKNAKVLVDPEKRKKLIEKQVKELAGSVGGIAGRLEGGLLDEVVNITEWPRALLGSFSQDYLSLPDALLETIMVHHQRYFPVDKNGGTKDGTSARSNNLHPYFITVSNNDIDKAQDTIRQGNERVLRARLADGKFFYLDDQKVKLADRTEALSQLTYQNGLGSYLDKRDRLVELAGILSRQLGLSSKLSVCLYETMALCKLDLVTNLVGELPELQGYVGGWYAELEGLPQDVSRAIASHYSPRHTDDTTPVDQVGAFAALLDKLDHITGLFCLGKRPSGSSDPFALRRNAQGLIDIVLTGCIGDYPVNLDSLCQHLLDRFEPMVEGQKKGFDKAKVKSDLKDFLIQRLKGKLFEHGDKREVVEAVLGVGNPLIDLADTKIRLTVMAQLLESDGGFDLIRAGVRLGNILKEDSPETLDESQLSEAAEKDLWNLFKNEVKPRLEALELDSTTCTKDQYQHLLDALKPLAVPVDCFFEQVMVNDEDLKKRNLRHAILKNIDCYFKLLADFTRLQPLLPAA